MNIYQKISIIGTSGSGKSTFAKKLALKLNCQHIELDALYWKENWVPSTHEELKNKIIPILENNRWVIEGNYRTIQSLIWDHADTIIWIDLPLHICLLNVFKRSISAILREELFYGHSKESFSRFFSKKSILLWVWNSYKRRKIQYTIVFKDLEGRVNLRLIKLKSFKEMNSFLEQISS